MQINESPNSPNLSGAHGVAILNDYGKHIAALGFSIAAFAVSIACALWLMGRTISAELRASNIEAQAMRDLGVEKRLNTQAIDELKLEMRHALKAAGVDPKTDYTHASK